MTGEGGERPPEPVGQGAERPPEPAGDAEVLDAVPVLAGAEARPIEPARPARALAPAVAKAAGISGAGVAAGDTTVALVRPRRLRKLARRRRRMLGPVLASRSFLVDVHVLGERK